MITAIILTLNEELHIARCIKSLVQHVDQIYVIDSFSTDNTVSIARDLGAVVIPHHFTNHSTQFNWALSNIGTHHDWILRVDADEYLEVPSNLSLSHYLDSLLPTITGVQLIRNITFMGKRIKFGGVGSLPVVRLFRFGYGFCDGRLMDEHIVVDGCIVHSCFKLVDDNLKGFHFWVSKHNNYASLECIASIDPPRNLVSGKLAPLISFKHYIKNNFYNLSPLVIRSFVYFIYRYFVRLGFLDGVRGLVFHLFHALFYRLLIDVKVAEKRGRFFD